MISEAKEVSFGIRNYNLAGLMPQILNLGGPFRQLGAALGPSEQEKGHLRVRSRICMDFSSTLGLHVGSFASISRQNGSLRLHVCF